LWLYTGNPPLLLAFLGGAEDALRVPARSPYPALAVGISMPVELTASMPFRRLSGRSSTVETA
jgi:hypothetical protein